MAWLSIKEFIIDLIKLLVVVVILFLMIYIVSVSTSAINFKPGKVELLFSFDSGYQLHVNFIDMNHDKKENLKKIYKTMMKVKIAS